MPSSPAGAHADRAKQFMPFAALRGFYELVAEVARFREDKRDLLDDHQDELDAALKEIMPGDFITVRHYQDEVYRETTGELNEVRELDRQIVVDGIAIDVGDVFDIEYTPHAESE